MSFSIINVQVTELCSDSAWNSYYLASLNINNGQVICYESFELSKDFDYEVKIDYSIELDIQSKIENLQKLENKLYLSENMLKFFKIHLLKEKIENKLLIKNLQENKIKI